MNILLVSRIQLILVYASDDETWSDANAPWSCTVLCYSEKLYTIDVQNNHYITGLVWMCISEKDFFFFLSDRGTYCSSFGSFFTSFY